MDYELAKVTSETTQRRYQSYRPAKDLLNAAKNLPASWAASVSTLRPDGTTGRVTPKTHFGVIASGQKVVTDPSLVKELQSDWPNLIGLEMEGVGVGLAAYESGLATEFLLVKGISDWADAKKSDDWQPYAAEAAAAFAAAFLRPNHFRQGLWETCQGS